MPEGGKLIGVYIKGMEMPNTCEKCNLESFCDKWIEARKMCGEWELGVKATIRHPDCPIVPVPEHGRLIDADALSAKLNTMLSMAFGEGNTAFHFAYRSLEKMVENAPTILPAEEGE